MIDSNDTLNDLGLFYHWKLWLGFVSSFNGISTFAGYSMLNLLSKENSSGTI